MFLLCKLLLHTFCLPLIFNMDGLYLLPIPGKPWIVWPDLTILQCILGEFIIQLPLVPQEFVDKHHLSSVAFTVSIFSSHWPVQVENVSLLLENWNSGSSWHLLPSWYWFYPDGHLHRLIWRGLSMLWKEAVHTNSPQKESWSYCPCSTT